MCSWFRVRYLQMEGLYRGWYPKMEVNSVQAPEEVALQLTHVWNRLSFNHEDYVDVDIDGRPTDTLKKARIPCSELPFLGRSLSGETG